MDKKNYKILLTVLAIVAVLSLIWVFVLSGDDSTEQTPPEVTPAPDQVEADQGETDGDADGQDQTSGDDTGDQAADEPQTELGMRAKAVLAAYQEVVAAQEQFTDSCPTTEEFNNVSGLIDKADAASEELAAAILTSDEQAIAEAQTYDSQVKEAMDRIAVLGPDIVNRCDLGHLLQG